MFTELAQGPGQPARKIGIEGGGLASPPRVGARRERRQNSSRSPSTASRFRCRKAPGSSRRRSRPGSRFPSSVTSRGSGRRSARAACASARSRRGRRSRRRLHAHGRRGMSVKTALTSELAAEAQNATLEFILVNHPLDCPVCDKGGECPLQDLTFRYGPGNTRMEFAKRTFEKPIPISPTIALDRERCILCYRCTRFSESVAEDGQLVAVERGVALDDRHLRGRAVQGAVLGQRDRALPGRCAAPPRSTASRRGRGRSRTCLPFAASAPSDAT